jgi:hypothetical protein
MEGHYGEVWGLCMSRIGDQVFSVSADKSIRIWRQTREQVRNVDMIQMFIEEEEEKVAEGAVLEELDRANVAVKMSVDDRAKLCPHVQSQPRMRLASNQRSPPSRSSRVSSTGRPSWRRSTRPMSTATRWNSTPCSYRITRF